MCWQHQTLALAYAAIYMQYRQTDSIGSHSIYTTYIIIYCHFPTSEKVWPVLAGPGGEDVQRYRGADRRHRTNVRLHHQELWVAEGELRLLVKTRTSVSGNTGFRFSKLQTPHGHYVNNDKYVNNNYERSGWEKKVEWVYLHLILCLDQILGGGESWSCLLNTCISSPFRVTRSGLWNNSTSSRGPTTVYLTGRAPSSPSGGRCAPTTSPMEGPCSYIAGRAQYSVLHF